jgi:hypothetical protein
VRRRRQQPDGALDPHRAGHAQDVSILFPLPAPPLRTSLIGAEESGTLGPLLPKEIYLELPYVDALLSNEATYPFLRVVSIRFDPCFPGLGEPCHAQIRLVMQPVTVSDDGEFLETLDAAIHTFYELPIDQWEGCLADVVGAREASSVEGEPVVGVHPALLTEGVEGAFMTSLREVLLRCGRPAEPNARDLHGAREPGDAGGASVATTSRPASSCRWS